MKKFLSLERVNIEMMNTDTSASLLRRRTLLGRRVRGVEAPDVSRRRSRSSTHRAEEKRGVDIVISDHESHRDD